MIRFSVMVGGYVHVLVPLSVVIVTLPAQATGSPKNCLFVCIILL